MTERAKLRSLYVSGFKSFAYSPLREIEKDGKKDFDYQGKRVEFGDVTVFLGANGAGKSNVVALFKLLEAIANGRMQEFVGLHGGAASFLHYGPRTTSHIDVRATFLSGKSSTDYGFSLAAAQPDTLRFTDETSSHASGRGDVTVGGSLGGLEESHLSRADSAAVPAQLIASYLRNLKTFQFDDTSATAGVRRGGYIEDAHELRTDGHNLAAFLYTLRIKHPAHYERIRRTVRGTCPQFDDFVLEPTALNAHTILLNWRANGHPDYLLGPHQLSDGTLRFMALATLLMQPTSMLPAMIVIDEPELGLHPHAISVLASLVKQASFHCQIVLATQSPTLVDEFDLADIRPMAHTSGSSTFLELNPTELEHWLDRYTLGEMWRRNLFRGGPEHV